MANTFHELEQAGWSDEGVAGQYERRWTAVTQQSIGALLDAAAVARGTRLLDVATGPGHVAAAALARGARVTAIDFSPAQLRIAAARHPGIAFEEGNAQRLRFAVASFDALTCGFGANHFSDPEAFLAEAHRVLDAGCRLALSVWAAPEEARAFGALFEAVRRHGSLDVGLPAGPDAFQFADAAKSRALLARHGFRDVRSQTVPQVWRVASPGECLDTFLQGAVRTRALLKAQSPEALRAIRKTYEESLGAYRRGAELEIPMPAVITSGAK